MFVLFIIPHVSHVLPVASFTCRIISLYLSHHFADAYCRHKVDVVLKASEKLGFKVDGTKVTDTASSLGFLDDDVVSENCWVCFK